MPNYHIHVYQIALKGEVNIKSESKEEAEKKALQMARKGEVSLVFPDCGQIALGFEIEEDFK